jgi:hypothetical protein
MNGPFGIIPTWQFSSDPNLNPRLNRFVPSSAAWQQAMNGLGYVMVNSARSTLGPQQVEQLRTSGQIDGVTDWFRAGGWLYENRWYLGLAGAALLAFSVWRKL